MRNANGCHFTRKNNNPWRKLLWKRLSIHLSDILKCQKCIFAFRHIFLSVRTVIQKRFSRRDFHKNALQLRLTTSKVTHILANLRLVRGFCQFLSVIISQNCREYDCIQRIQWFVCSGGSWYHRNRFLVTVISGIKSWADGGWIFMVLRCQKYENFNFHQNLCGSQRSVWDLLFSGETCSSKNPPFELDFWVRGGIGLCLKATFPTLLLTSVVLAGRKLTGKEHFRKSSISAFQNTKNY